jgi:hypothetical protein
MSSSSPPGPPPSTWATQALRHTVKARERRARERMPSAMSKPCAQIKSAILLVITRACASPGWGSRRLDGGQLPAVPGCRSTAEPRRFAEPCGAAPGSRAARKSPGSAVLGRAARPADSLATLPGESTAHRRRNRWRMTPSTGDHERATGRHQRAFQSGHRSRDRGPSSSGTRFRGGGVRGRAGGGPRRPGDRPPATGPCDPATWSCDRPRRPDPAGHRGKPARGGSRCRLGRRDLSLGTLARLSAGRAPWATSGRARPRTAEPGGMPARA